MIEPVTYLTQYIRVKIQMLDLVLYKTISQSKKLIKIADSHYYFPMRKQNNPVKKYFEISS